MCVEHYDFIYLFYIFKPDDTIVSSTSQVIPVAHIDAFKFYNFNQILMDAALFCPHEKNFTTGRC